MRKLIGALLAAAALTPAAAVAQDGRFRARSDVQADGVEDGDRAAGRERWRARRGGVDGGRQAAVTGDIVPRPEPQARGDWSGRSDARVRTAEDDRAVGTFDRGQDRRDRTRWDQDRGDQPRGDRTRGDWTGRGERDRPARNDRADRAPDRDRDGRDGDRFRRGDRTRFAAQPDWARSRFADRRDDDWARSSFEDRRAWNRGWRDDGRYDWNGYRSANRGDYRLPRYYAPYGWGSGYRRFGIGISLQPQLWDRNYWIADPWSYRLPEAYGPYRWVRYYDDALLVDLRSGIVIDAVYGIFW